MQPSQNVAGPQLVLPNELNANSETGSNTRGSPGSNAGSLKSAERAEEHSDMDEGAHPSGSSSDGPITGQPRSAAARLALLAASMGDEQLRKSIESLHQPMLTTTGRGRNNHRYTFFEFTSLELEELRLACGQYLHRRRTPERNRKKKARRRL